MNSAGDQFSPISDSAINIRMQEALECAQNSIGLSDPNPRVGCVIVDTCGRVIGRGHTQHAGGPHAEVMALRDAASRKESVIGATVYVTLEPCAHYGRTPPCSEALIEAGVARVVIALPDTHPQVSGKGAARLRKAGLDVIELPSGRLQNDAYELNIGFFSRTQRGRPWVRLKAAASLDGKTALLNGSSQWITAEAARLDTHAWRKRAGAVMTGAGTVRADNPRLDVRLVPTQFQPLRVIIDSKLSTPIGSAILGPPGRVLIYTAAFDSSRQSLFEKIGVEVSLAPGAAGRVDLKTVLDDLGQRGINELHIEAGQELNSSFVREALVDEFLLYFAPRLLGPGREIISLIPAIRLEDSIEMNFCTVDTVGTDLRIVARFAESSQKSN